MFRHIGLSCLLSISLSSFATLVADDYSYYSNYNSSSDFCPAQYNCGCGMVGGIDFLYWKPRQDLAYAVQQLSTLEPSNSAAQVSRISPMDLDYKWEGGVRLYAGFKPACMNWDIELAYTYFDSRTNKDFSAFNSTPSSVVGIVPLLVTSSLAGPFGETNLGVQYRLNLNVLDLTLTRECCLCEGLILRPFLGARLLATHEKLLQEFTFVEGLSFEETINTHFTNDFTALGIVAGLESAYELGCGIQLYGGFDLSIVYGDYKVNQHTINRIESGGSTTLNDAHSQYHFWDDRLITDLELGFKWVKQCDSGNQFAVRFGWEYHIYSSLNQWGALDTLSGFVESLNIERGDLHLKGFILGADFSF